MPDPCKVSRFRVTDWSRLQHYKNRTPPWIKLYQDFMGSQTWVSLDDASRVLAVACMLLASRSECHDGTFPNDPVYIKRACFLNQEPDFKPLLDTGFIEPASTMLAPCYQDARPEERRGEENRGETEEREAKPNRATALPKSLTLSAGMKEYAVRKGVDPEAEWEQFVNYHEAKGSKFKSWEAAWRTWVGKAVQFRGNKTNTDSGVL